MMKSITQSIIKAEKKCSDDPASTGALKKIIDRIHFRFNRFARMTMARCHKANYAPDHPELQKTAEFLGAGSNTTADIMEGTINNLQRKTWVVGKNEFLCQMIWCVIGNISEHYPTGVYRY